MFYRVVLSVELSLYVDSKGTPDTFADISTDELTEELIDDALWPQKLQA